MTLLTVRAKEISRKEDTPSRGAEPASFWGQQNSWVFLLPELS